MSFFVLNFIEFYKNVSILLPLKIIIMENIDAHKDDIKNNVINWVKAHLSYDFKFREGQFDAIINIIYEQINNKNHHHIIQAPTGSGKSFINIIAAGVLYEYFNKQSYILCSDLYLFKQYSDIIDEYNLSDFGYLKGQTNNYICQKAKCDIRQAPCKMMGLSYGDIQSIINNTPNERINNNILKNYQCIKTCEYIKNRFDAVNAPITVMTYHLFHFQMNVCTMKYDSHDKLLPGQFGYRDYVFCDEAHNIPSIFNATCRPTIKKDDINRLRHILNYYVSLKKNPQKVKLLKKIDQEKLNNLFSEYWGQMFNVKMTSYENTILLLNYARKLLNPMHIVSERIQGMLATKVKRGLTLNEKEREIYSNIAWFQNYHCYIDDFCKAIELTGFHYTYKQIINKKEVLFGCVKEDGIISQFLLKNANAGTIVCSATIGDQDSFIENMGYKYDAKEGVSFINIDSSFDFSNSPIYIDNEVKVNYNNKKQAIPKITNKIINIANTHYNENGIIQTGSYEVSKMIYDNLPNYLKLRTLIYKNSSEKEECISKVKNNTNYIIMGPSLVEGIDLPGEKCKFVIIAKIPFLSLGDLYVRSKMRIFKKWYNVHTMNSLIQGIGRGNRFISDKSNVYIIDACFKRIFSYTKKFWPNYITNRFIYTNVDELYNKENNENKCAA